MTSSTTQISPICCRPKSDGDKWGKGEIWSDYAGGYKHKWFGGCDGIKVGNQSDRGFAILIETWWAQEIILGRGQQIWNHQQFGSLSCSNLAASPIKSWKVKTLREETLNLTIASKCDWETLKLYSSHPPWSPFFMSKKIQLDHI